MWADDSGRMAAGQIRLAIMTNLNNEIGLCHHCQEPIWENESYIQRGSLEGGEIEQYHVPCFREVEPKGGHGLMVENE